MTQRKTVQVKSLLPVLHSKEMSPHNIENIGSQKKTNTVVKRSAIKNLILWWSKNVHFSFNDCT